MGRKRERASSAGLLPGMEARLWKDGTTVTYRYHPHEGKPIPLGRDLDAALRMVLDLKGQTPHQGSLRWVWEKYQQHPRFTKLADATRADYQRCWKEVGKALGHMPIAGISTPMIARYVHVERASAGTRANHEKALLSNLFAFGVIIGACTSNPAKEVPPHETESRTMAVDPQVLARFSAWVDRLSPQRRMVGLAARFAALAGNRQIEFRPLTTQQIDWERGIARLPRAKQRGGKRQLVWEEIVLSPRAMDVLRQALEIQPKDRPRSNVIFATRNGSAYSDGGFKALWQRIVQAALAEKIITEVDRFTFHDLRAFYATQYKLIHGTLPDLHKNPQTTASVYDRSRVVRRKTL